MPVGRRFATIVTSAAGHPLDKTYYQTVKGMVTPLDILEPGGTLIVASACSEGFGSPEFRAAQAPPVARSGPTRFLQTLLAEALRRRRRVADRDAAEVDARRARPALHDRPRRRGAAASPASRSIGSIDAALAAALARSGDPAVAVVPEGPYVVPVVA